MYYICVLCLYVCACKAVNTISIEIPISLPLNLLNTQMCLVKSRQISKDYVDLIEIEWLSQKIYKTHESINFYLKTFYTYISIVKQRIKLKFEPFSKDE